MIDPETQIKCLRCGRPFVQKHMTDKYGPKCARIMAGQTMLQDRYVVPPRKRRQKKPQNLSPEEDAVRAYRGAVIV